jgi:hypothetical protein
MTIGGDAFLTTQQGRLRKIPSFVRFRISGSLLLWCGPFSRIAEGRSDVGRVLIGTVSRAAAAHTPYDAAVAVLRHLP